MTNAELLDSLPVGSVVKPAHGKYQECIIIEKPKRKWSLLGDYADTDKVAYLRELDSHRVIAWHEITAWHRDSGDAYFGLEVISRPEEPPAPAPSVTPQSLLIGNGVITAEAWDVAEKMAGLINTMNAGKAVGA